MTHNHDGDAVFWFVIVAASLVLLVVASGCATTKQSVEVTAAYSGERPEVQASYKVNMP